MLVELLALLIIAVMIYYVYKYNRSNLPPGPINIPLVGSVPFVSKQVHLTMTQWAHKYGKLFGFRKGNQLIVVINDFETMKRVFSDENTTRRFIDLRTSCRLKDNLVHGLVFSDGEHWKEQRRFAISTLRDFGMGKAWLEDVILAEVGDLCDQLTSRRNQPINPRTLFTHSVSNVICALVFGKRFSHSNEAFTKLTTLLPQLVTLSTTLKSIAIFPFLKYVPGKGRTAWREFQIKETEILHFVQVLIDEHGEHSAAEKKDYIDAFLAQKIINSQGGNTSFTDFQLLMSVYDLFFAGTDTTSTTMLWTLLFLLENSDILPKIKAEIADNVAADQPIRMNDRKFLPYTEATILEVQRLASLVPLNMPHRTWSDMEIDGYFIPKETVVLSNSYFIHRDSKYWTAPEQFDPTRFLNGLGKVTKPDGFIPFSTGKRACLGESLANMELWLFLANLMKRFNFKSASGRVDSRDVDFKIMLSPKPFEVIFE